MAQDTCRPLPESGISTYGAGENTRICSGLGTRLDRVPAESITETPGEEEKELAVTDLSCGARQEGGQPAKDCFGF